jgi:hypothetical protein
MQNTTQFIITGLMKDSIQFKIDSDYGEHTPYSVLLQSETIEAVHPTTNTDKTGNWVIVTTRTQIRQATIFFDNEIEELFKHIPMEPICYILKFLSPFESNVNGLHIPPDYLLEQTSSINSSQK